MSRATLTLHPSALPFTEVLGRYRMQLSLTLLFLGILYSHTVASMVLKWYRDPNYSHGFIVPLVSGYALYRQAGALKGAAARPENRGLLLVILGLFVFTAARLGAESFTMGVSLLIVLAGLVISLFGREVFRAAAFPIGYLFMMVPLPYTLYDSIAFPLKLLVTQGAVAFLKVIGVVVWREGNIIMFPDSVFEVADACSGIRSLMSLIALSAALAYFFQNTLPRRLAVVLSAVPIAVFANWLRVVATGILAQFWGARAAEGLFHDFAGITVFGLATAMLIAVGFMGGRRR
ncbi:MAG TPA: exosortase A [Dissulfurispiraceae bacterium]